jgi:ribosomal protein S11
MLKEYKKKKTNFFFGFDPLKKEGCLFVKKSYNNLFITLTDFNKHVICCKTSGAILKNKLKSSKRQRKSPQTLNLIIEKLLNYLNLYNIRRIRIY